MHKDCIMHGEFSIFTSSKNEVGTPIILTSCYSNNRSAAKFNVGPIQLDGISKIWVYAIGFDPMTNYFEGKQ